MTNLGNELRDQGKLDEAIAAYRQAIGLKPELAEAHSNLGIALEDQGKLDEAVAAYRQAISIKPDFAEAYSNLGNALEGSRQARRGDRRISPGDRHQAGLRRGAFQSCCFALNYRRQSRRANTFSPRTENGMNDMAGRYRGRPRMPMSARRSGG